MLLTRTTESTSGSGNTLGPEPAFVVGSAVDQHIKLDGLFHEVVHVVKAHRLLGQHQRFLTGRLDVIGHVQFGVGIERSGRGARFGEELERTDHVEPKVVHKAPQLLKVLVGLPGNPTINVVRIATPGMRSGASQQLNLLLTGGPARIKSKTGVAMCCRGISMYLTMLGNRVASIISSVKSVG